MFKKWLPVPVRNALRPYFNRTRWKGKSRVFCLSMQRTGTTSVGNFFIHFGYPTARWGDSVRNSWTKSWYEGDFEAIFSSKDFWSKQVFEDDPWWLPEFYKVLFHRFPNSKFILFIRDSDSWFQSMVSHSYGKTIGNTIQHCKIYRREQEFYNMLDNDPNFNPSYTEIDNLLDLKGQEEHYKTIYEIRNREIIDFFERTSPESLFVCNLYDEDKWKKLGDFMGIKVPNEFEIHAHKSSTK